MITINSFSDRKVVHRKNMTSSKYYLDYIILSENGYACNGQIKCSGREIVFTFQKIK